MHDHELQPFGTMTRFVPSDHVLACAEALTRTRAAAIRSFFMGRRSVWKLGVLLPSPFGVVTDVRDITHNRRAPLPLAMRANVTSRTAYLT
jgi:hypothetical protein